MLREHGEHDVAQLFLHDRREFERRHEAGRVFFHGSRDDGDELPDWLKVLLDLVADCTEVKSPAGPLGVRCGQEQDAWEVTIYPTRVELVGGAADGEVVTPGFTLDLERLREAFTRLDAFDWNALGLHDPDGPHVYLEGDFMAHELVLRVLAQAPQTRGRGRSSACDGVSRLQPFWIRRYIRECSNNTRDLQGDARSGDDRSGQRD